jgi:diguanylate cyclase (GGDEF)-like protein
MVSTANPGLRFASRLSEFVRLRQPWIVAAVFAILIAAQALSFLTLGTGRWGCALAQSLLVLGNLVALACAWIAFRRARGITAIFWFLFSAILLIWMVPTGIQAFDTLFDVSTLSDSTWRLLYCLYGAPILMMLFLPDSSWRTGVNSEIFLDLFQIAIVVALIYSTFFFLPVRQMQPADAFLRNVNISDAQSIVLLVAVLLRLQFASGSSTRSLLRRFALFLLVCAVTTFVGDRIELHHYAAASAWFYLAWNLNQAAPALIAITWVPAPDPFSAPEPAKFISFLTTNLCLVAMLVGLDVLMDRWEQAHGALLTDIAIIASLVAFTLRLALTQYHQQQEISQRKAAQEQLSASNDKVSHLLDDARRQTAEITQISELGSLLQACASREEIFRLVPERLRRLFPDASGSISLLTASKARLETVANWGIGPTGQIVSPTECWALRRGTVHVHPRGHSGASCSHFTGEGASVCIPLIALGDAIGILAIQDNDFQNNDFQTDDFQGNNSQDHDLVAKSESDSGPDRSTRQRHLAGAVAEHVAVAIANLGLRESLRLQAVRDPLTGLYNRRYMQEFLERELHSARRRHRPVTVMMLDLDHFKRFNDSFGHAAGDRVLASVGEILQRSVRAEDVACRYGGEEFTLILPECNLQQASVRAEIVRKRVAENCSHPGKGPADGVTISVGIAAFDETTDRVDLLLKFADDALYKAKRNGRNRVVQASPTELREEIFIEENPAAAAASNSE